ncbi:MULTISPECIES: hypothetical protein [unclassified Tolypothrix]|uniref:hypothetical protein n=1 Tax=unclassified Tolypothrix TaxID=2649714 RepID=UPI0005F7C807|nr:MULTISPECIES: hypothetical protein [unclassified Tolypothrix]MBE9086792.1 hypothetical protein [Tolypothrix sp. LEGE 11397]UYD28933.1 hypothetical protein HGR01_13365 [Tolypothrix sp. PCC 7712]UYD35154.1 hypothetical protein HG267_04980 [Tolypothrix sp. PCC 7601]BAY88230.1 hypothetical protein NIES3275_02050 [Microchaete diplosiphon NIES-3275]
MNNPSDRESYHSENRQESYTDANGETRTHVQRTTETVNNTGNYNSYGSGYVTGRNAERRYQQANLVERDNSNTANGLLLGVILASLVTLGAAAFWYFNQRNNEPVNNAAPVFVPVPSSASPSPAASQSPQTKTTIIERTREVPVVIPQQSPPSQSAPSQPNINITVPSQRPAAERVPSASPSTSTPSQQSPTDNSSTQDKSSDTLTNSPLKGAGQSNTDSNSGTSSSGDSKTGQ